MDDQVRRDRDMRLEVLRMAQHIVNSRYELKVNQIVHDAHLKNKGYKVPLDNRTSETVNLAEEFLDFVEHAEM
jgi:F420-0:gamma-glutamyl ligase-like protein